MLEQGLPQKSGRALAGPDMQFALMAHRKDVTTVVRTGTRARAEPDRRAASNRLHLGCDRSVFRIPALLLWAQPR